MLYEIEGTITASRRFGECAQAHGSKWQYFGDLRTMGD